MSETQKEITARRWQALKNMGFEFKQAAPRANYAGFILTHKTWNYGLTVYIDYNKKMTKEEVYDKWLRNAEEYSCLLDSPGWVGSAKKVLTLAKVERQNGRLSGNTIFPQGELL